MIVLHAPFKKHLHIIDQVLHCLQNKNIILNIAKSEWAKNKVNFLGFIPSQEGKHPQETKIQTILQMQPPQNKNMGFSIFRISEFFKRFVAHMSHFIKPLTSLTGKF